MKTIKYALSCLLLSASLNSYANVSCGDLSEMATDLDQIAEALTQVDVIHEGDELDQALGQLVDALQIIADAENTDRFYRHVDRFTSAYNDMDSNRFEGTLDDIIAYMDKMYVRDCE